MQDHPGLFIVLEGSDGSGKATQLNLLKERLQVVGYNVAVFDFPRYEEPSSHFVKRYLNGDYGPAADINPYTASLFYALDRFEAASKIRKALDDGKIVLSNRYAGSNMAHQGSKFTNTGEQRGFFVWADSMEFQLLGIPRPNLNIYLRVPAELSYKLIAKKAARSYTNASHDQHEADINHLKRAVETYDLLCQLFPKDFYAINCTDDGRMLSIPAINDLIWQHLQPYLSNIPKHQPHSKVVSLSNIPVPEPAANPGPNIANFNLDSRSQPLKIKLTNISLLAARGLAASTDIETQIELSKKPLVDEPKLSNEQLLKRYRKVMSENNASRQLMLKVMQKSKDSKPAEVLLAATPLAHFCDVDIRGTSSALQKLIIKTSNSRLDELNAISQTLYSSARAKRPEEFKSTPGQKLDHTFGDETSNIINKLPAVLVDLDTALQLVTTLPRNELELVNESVYKNSSLAQSEVLLAIDKLSYDQKSELLKSYLNKLGSEPNIVQAISYVWEILASGVTLNYLLSKGLLERVIMQPATPRYGYEVPDWITNAGVEELFTECFDDSLKLFSELQSSGHEEQAQYAVLMGHRLRWQATMPLNKILLFKPLVGDSDCPTEAKSLFEAMQQAISQAHPLIGELLATHETLKQPNTPGGSKISSTSRRRPKRRPKKPTQN